MKNKNSLFGLMIVLATLGQAAQTNAQAPFQKENLPRPNIVLVLIDDMGMMDSSEPFLWDKSGKPILHPTMPYRTPNMERLADTGMKFPNAYAMVVCSPSRTSILTGENSVRHHVTDWCSQNKEKKNRNPLLAPPPDWPNKGMLDKKELLTTYLTKAGYRTLLVGKTHWGSNYNDPKSVGFQRAVGYAPGCKNKLDCSEELPGMIQYKNSGTFVTEALTLEMKKFIDEAVADSVPFYAYLSHFAVHYPLALDSRFKDNYPSLSGAELEFATMIEGIDKSLGDILDHLNKLGIAENTLVVFMGDNGSVSPAGENKNNSLPLRGMKAMQWEGGSRVPCIMSWANPDPANPIQKIFPIQSDAVEDDIVTIYDLFPTFLEVANIPFTKKIDGVSLTPYLAGIPGTHRPQNSLIHYPHDHNSCYFTSLREDDWKLIYSYVTEKYQLYNLKEDLGESIDVSHSYPERVKEMAHEMADMLNDANAQLPVLEKDNKTERKIQPPK